MMMGMVVVWLIIVIVIAARGRGMLLAGHGWSSALPPERERSPEELARERYARGEIGAPEYEEMLINLLKERYVRGELELAEYEERTSRVLDEAVLVPARPNVRLEAPAVVSRAPETASPRPSTTIEAAADSAQKREARTDPALETLQRRYLSGELTDREYEEQQRRLRTA